VSKKRSVKHKSKVLAKKDRGLTTRETKSIWKMITIISFIIGAVGFYFLLIPKISISPGKSFDQSNPFATRFRISNNGILPAYHMRPLCGVNEVRADATGNLVGAMTLDTDSPSIRKLSGGEFTDVTFPFFFQFESPITSADIVCTVTYRSPIAFTLRKKQQRFTTRKGQDGFLYWEAKGLAE
jgi:hypothetical protein